MDGNGWKGYDCLAYLKDTRSFLIKNLSSRLVKKTLVGTAFCLPTPPKNEIFNITGTWPKAEIHLSHSTLYIVIFTLCIDHILPLHLC